MKRYLAMTVFAIIMIGTASCAWGSVVFIDFNDGTGDGDAVGDFYAVLGITFADAAWSDRFAGRPGASSPFHLNSLSASGFPKIENPILGFFSSPVDMVMISAIDVGFNDARLDAYDSITGGNLIATSTYEGLTEIGNTLTDIDTGILSVSVPGIRRIELYQPNLNTSVDGVGFDSLAFNIVPEPASSLILLGMGSIATLRRHRRT